MHACTSPAPRLHLACTSPAPRLHLACTSRAPRLHLARAADLPGVEIAEEEQSSLTVALERFSCVPLYLDTELHKTFYFGFCRAFLWPTFHNVIKARCFSQKVWLLATSK